MAFEHIEGIELKHEDLAEKVMKVSARCAGHELTPGGGLGGLAHGLTACTTICGELFGTDAPMDAKRTISFAEYGLAAVEGLRKHAESYGEFLRGKLELDEETAKDAAGQSLAGALIILGITASVLFNAKPEKDEATEPEKEETDADPTDE